MLLGDETAATQTILDLSDAQYINIEIQFTYVVTKDRRGLSSERAPHRDRQQILDQNS
jgi:hypothetical protein